MATRAFKTPILPFPVVHVILDAPIIEKHTASNHQLYNKTTFSAGAKQRWVRRPRHQSHSYSTIHVPKMGFSFNPAEQHPLPCETTTNRTTYKHTIHLHPTKSDTPNTPATGPKLHPQPTIPKQPPFPHVFQSKSKPKDRFASNSSQVSDPKCPISLVPQSGHHPLCRRLRL